MNRLWILFLLFSVIYIGCAKKKILTENTEKTSLIKHKTESFIDFYERFHQDSLFQISRLYEPIKGERVDHDTSYSWNKSNWEMIKYKIRDIDTSEYKIKITENDKYVIEEVEYLYETGFYFKSKYSLINGKWFLVECIDYNL